MNVTMCDFDGHIVSVQCTLRVVVRGEAEPFIIPLVLNCKSDDSGLMSSYSVLLCNANLEQWKFWESIAEQKKDYIKAFLFARFEKELCRYELTAPPFFIN